MTAKQLAIALLINLLITQNSLGNKCRNERGAEVSWFLCIRLVSKADERVYAVMDSKSKRFRLTSEDLLMNIGLFDRVDASEDLILAWNDNPASNYHSEEDESSESTAYAHSKGLIVVNRRSNTGFFLSHSIPDYPSIGQDIIIGVSPERSFYGQHALCISLNRGKSDVDRIWEHIQHTKPNIYIDRFGYTVDQPRVYRYPTKTTTFDLNEFTIIVKQKGNKDQVYEEIFLPYWKRMLGKDSLGFYTETWGRPLRDPVCSGDSRVYDIQEIKILNHSWRITQDHSKWALADDPSTNLFCVSDLNHMTSQAKRGGMFLCIRDADVYKEMSTVITSTSCNITPRSSLRTALELMRK